MSACEHPSFKLSTPDCTYEWWHATCEHCGASLGDYNIIEKKFEHEM